MSVNKVLLIGNMGADPDVRFTQDGTCVANVRLATTEKWKDRGGQQKERTEWHRLVFWGKLAEIVNQYLSKGSRIFIEGKLETRKWQDKDGQDRYTTEIRVSELKMLGGGTKNGGSEGHAARNPDGQDPFADAPVDGDMPIPDDDIPFGV